MTERLEAEYVIDGKFGELFYIPPALQDRSRAVVLPPSFYFPRTDILPWPDAFAITYHRDIEREKSGIDGCRPKPLLACSGLHE
jgi:hypothetical protein